MHACHNLIQPVLTCLYFFLIWYERRPCGPNLLHFVVGNLSTPPVVIGTLLPRTFVPGSQSSNLDLQISRIWRETRAFEVYLTLSRLRLKSHAFRPHLKFLLQTKVTKNCYHHMRFLGSNVTEMPWRADPWDVGIKREVQGREGKEGEWGKRKGRGISCIGVLPTWQLRIRSEEFQQSCIPEHRNSTLPCQS